MSLFLTVLICGGEGKNPHLSLIYTYEAATFWQEQHGCILLLGFLVSHGKGK